MLSFSQKFIANLPIGLLSPLAIIESVGQYHFLTSKRVDQSV